MQNTESATLMVEMEPMNLLSVLNLEIRILTFLLIDKKLLVLPFRFPSHLFLARRALRGHPALIVVFHFLTKRQPAMNRPVFKLRKPKKPKFAPDLAFKRRVATLDDLDDIVDVVQGGYPGDPEFSYRFPHRLVWPEDNRKWVRKEYEEYIVQFVKYTVLVVTAEESVSDDDMVDEESESSTQEVLGDDMVRKDSAIAGQVVHDNHTINKEDIYNEESMAIGKNIDNEDGMANEEDTVGETNIVHEKGTTSNTNVIEEATQASESSTTNQEKKDKGKQRRQTTKIIAVGVWDMLIYEKPRKSGSSLPS
jgi:hypothetical protein